jgi:hypothetical protein
MCDETVNENKIIFENVKEVARYLDISERRIRQCKQIRRLNYTTNAGLGAHTVVNSFGNSVSLWKASHLNPPGSVSITNLAARPLGACSDGLSFWITLNGKGKPVRF